MIKQKPYQKLFIVLAILLLAIPLLAACAGGATPATGDEATEGGTAEEEPVLEDAAEDASEATVGDEAVVEESEEEAEGEAEGGEAEEAVVLPTANPELANLSPDVPEPEEPVTVSFASWVGDTETMRHLAAEFEKLHPNISIDFQTIPFEEIRTRLLTQVAANNPPDTAFMDASTTADFASRGALVNLDPYIEQSNAVDPDDYVEAFANSAMFEGSMYGLPFDAETTGLFYRTDLFEEAGIDGPPETWEEFRAAAEALTNPEESQYGFILFAPEAAYYWYPWLWQAGGDLISEDGTEIIWDSEEGKRAAEFYVGLTDVSPPDYLNSNSWDGRVAFAQGNVGMYIAGAWFAGTLMSEFPDIDGLWATAPLPEDQRCATTIAGDNLVMFEGSQNKDAAWKWIEFLSAPENMRLWNIGTPDAPSTLLPPRKSLLEDPATFENNPVLEGFAEGMECAVTSTTAVPEWPEIEAELNEALGEAMYGEVDPATAIEAAAQEGQEILDE